MENNLSNIDLEIEQERKKAELMKLRMQNQQAEYEYQMRTIQLQQQLQQLQSQIQPPLPTQLPTQLPTASFNFPATSNSMPPPIPPPPLAASPPSSAPTNSSTPLTVTTTTSNGDTPSSSADNSTETESKEKYKTTKCNDCVQFEGSLPLTNYGGDPWYFHDDFLGCVPVLLVRNSHKKANLYVKVKHPFPSPTATQKVVFKATLCHNNQDLITWSGSFANVPIQYESWRFIHSSGYLCLNLYTVMKFIRGKKQQTGNVYFIQMSISTEEKIVTLSSNVIFHDPKKTSSRR